MVLTLASMTDFPACPCGTSWEFERFEVLVVVVYVGVVRADVAAKEVGDVSG